MAEREVSEKQIINAQISFKNFKAVLDHYDLKYEEHPDEQVIVYYITGDDIPMQFVFVSNAERNYVRITSKILTAADDYMTSLMVACNIHNSMIRNGKFMVDPSDNDLRFSLVQHIGSDPVDFETCDYMLRLGVTAVDEVNDTFLFMNKGKMSVSDFIEKFCQ